MLAQSLEETLALVRAAQAVPASAVLQQPLNFDDDTALDSFIGDHNEESFDDDDIPYLTDDTLMSFLSSRELAQHQF